jgi:hypothetical protein
VEKIWFILIDECKEGPFSLLDLRSDPRITPDTLVWKEGFESWVPIRNISELQSVFEDSNDSKDKIDEKDVNQAAKKINLENDVIALRSDPPFHYLSFIIALILIFYVIYQLSQFLK